MSTSRAHAQLFDPIADSKAVVVSGSARFTILTPRLIRMEWSADGKFVDRASLAAVNRKLPAPEFTTSREGGWLQIRTPVLTLRYRENAGRFDAENLRVAISIDGKTIDWTPAARQESNLLGTYRTLDGVSGASQLDAGLLARDGWTLIDDSQRLLLSGGDRPWITPRKEKDVIDWYLLAYGRDYPQALRDYTAIAGRVPLPPRFVFGAWWSRYWAYSDAELKQIVEEFEQHDVPLDVLVVDMDWHLDGWTGYTWNPKCFPDPPGFLRWVHDRGLKVTLNLHPADGVGKHESAFADVARAMELDPAKTDRVPFDCTDPRFVDAYFKYLHHPLERQGVDFWWIDWQQGQQTRVAGLDPLWWLNYLHWTDMARNPDRRDQRPLLFSRWGGLGNHRYQIGFSGDTFCDWASLAFQPYFTATAGNVCYPYWSHDIGGHQPGVVDPELYVRWIQWAAFNPVLRTHTTKNPDAERRIWAFDEATFRNARDAWLLRYSLVPYIYTAARQAYDDALPLCRPLYYAWPELEEAYRHPSQYLFGEDLLCAPVTEPVDKFSGLASTTIWIPPGRWTHWFTGRSYEGPREFRLATPLDQIPVFVRAGAVIPLSPRMSRTGERPLDPLILEIFPHADSGKTRVYEDDGATLGYQRGQCAWTPVSFARNGADFRVVVGAAEGRFPGLLPSRSYKVRFRDVWPPEQVLIEGNVLEPLPASKDATQPSADDPRPGWRYDADELTLIVRTPPRETSSPTELTVRAYSGVAGQDAALRSGLRGRLAALRDVSAMLGDAAPPMIATLTKLPRQLAGSGPTFPQIAQHIVNNWPIAADDVQRVEVDTHVLGRAIARLLGLSLQIRITADSGDATRALANIRLAPTDGFPLADSVRVETTVDAVNPWRVEGKTTFAATNVSEATPAELDVPLVCTDRSPLPLTGEIRGVAHVQLNQFRFQIPFRQEFLPSIGGWWVVGPFDAPFEAGLRTSFEPEKSLDLKASYVGKDEAKVEWRRVVRTVKPGDDVSGEFVVSFDSVFGKHHENAVAYAYTLLQSKHERDATLALGSDDGVAVWLNGQEVHRSDVGRPFHSKQDRVRIHLNAGYNTLLLKVKQGGGDWRFAAHVESTDGRPVMDVLARLEP